MSQDASTLYAKNLFNLFKHIYNKENPLNLEDEITNGSMLINKGKINNTMLQEFLDKDNN